MITHRSELDAEIRRLSQMTEGPVLSLYLSLDGHDRPRRHDYVSVFRRLAHEVRAQPGLTSRTVEQVERDIHRIDRLLTHLDRGPVRGLAVFASRPHQLWTVIELPQPVHDSAVVADTPHLMQLITIASQSHRYCLALFDEERLRLLEYEFGQLAELPALIATAGERDLQRDTNVAGSDSATGGAATRWVSAGSHVDRHREATQHFHLARAADALSDCLDHHAVDFVLIGGPAPGREHLARAIASHHRNKFGGYLALAAGASLAEIERTASEAVTEIQEQLQHEVITSLEDAVDRDEAISGLAGVLTALSHDRLRSLVVSEGYTPQPGSVCAACGTVSPPADSCPSCGAATQPRPDIVEAAVEMAVRRRIEVAVVDSSHPLASVGGLAGLPRFVPTVA